MLEHDENKIPKENTEPAPEAPVEVPVPEAPPEVPAPEAPMAPEPPQGNAPQKDQVDVYVKEAKNILRASWDFEKKLVKGPMSAMAEKLPLPSAILFAVLQPIALFLFVRVLAGQLLGLMPFGLGGLLAPTFGQWVQLFFLTILYYALYLFLLLVLSVVFGKLICKAQMDLKQLFTQTVAAHIPLTGALLGAMIFAIFGMGLASGFFMSIALAVLLVGGIATYILYAKALTVVFKTSEDKGFYTALAAYGVLIILSMLIAL